MLSGRNSSFSTMWSFASSALAGLTGPRKVYAEPSPVVAECSDDESSSCSRQDEGLECPICLESFNIVENVPYVLWCGHTLCKNCVLELKWAVVRFPTIPVQLPLFISCPWCQSLSFRLVYRGNLRFPCKNYFLLWMIESMNGNRSKSRSVCRNHTSDFSSAIPLPSRNPINSTNCHNPLNSYLHNSRPNPNAVVIHTYLKESLAFFVNMTSKFPLAIIFLLIVLYAIPASAAVLALYIIITVVFAVPSFLILYFAYPTLDWLVREILS